MQQVYVVLVNLIDGSDVIGVFKKFSDAIEARNDTRRVFENVTIEKEFLLD